MHTSEGEAHSVIERGRAARLEILNLQRIGLRHRSIVIQMFCLTATECHQRHKMVLGVGKLLLGFLDSCQSLVEPINSGSAYAPHRTATIEDDDIEYLGLLNFLLCFHFLPVL